MVMLPSVDAAPFSAEEENPSGRHR